MAFTHILMALAVCFLWGCNFIAIKYSYESFPPFASLTIRFILTLIPLIFFVPRPKCSWGLLFEISLFQWIGQFGMSYSAIYLGLTPGLTALLLQSHIIFTLLISIFFYQYKPQMIELLGICIAVLGFSLIGAQIDGTIFIGGFLCVLFAGLSIACSTMILREQRNLNMFQIIIWSCIFPILPMYGLSWFFEGPQALFEGFSKLTVNAGISLLYTAYFSTIVATPLWGILLKNYEPAKIAPFMLLIPVFAMISSYFAFGETLTTSSIIASALTIIGLFVNQLSRRLTNRFITAKEARIEKA